MGKNKLLVEVGKDIFMICLVAYFFYATKILFGKSLIANINIYVVSFAMFLFFVYSLYNLKKYKNDEKEVVSNLGKLYKNIGIFLFALFLNAHLKRFIDAWHFKIEFKILDLLILVNLLIWIVWYFLFLFKDKEKKDENEEDEKILYPSREAQSNILKSYIDEENNLKSFILIDGEWGIGKSTFVDLSLKNFGYIERQIYINAMLFNNKKEIVKVLFDELGKYFEKNNICSKGMSEAKDYLLAVMGEGSKFFGKFFGKEESYNDKRETLKKQLKKLNEVGKQPIIVVDNLERINDKDHIVEILGFLHEVEELDELKTLVLADRSKIEDLKIPKDYLDKFFIYNIQLREVSIREIVSDYSEDYKNEVLSFYSDFNFNMQETKGELSNNSKKIGDKYNELIKEIEYKENILMKKLNNPRTHQKLVGSLNAYRRWTKNIFFEDIEYLREVEFMVVLYEEIINGTLNIENIKKAGTNNFLAKSNSVDLKNLYSEIRGEDIFLSLFFKYESYSYTIEKEKYLNLLHSINYPLLEIEDAKNCVLEIYEDIRKINNYNISELLKYMEVYSNSISHIFDMRLIQFFKNIKTRLINEIEDFPLYSKEIDFRAFIVLDRVTWIVDGDSIFYLIHKKFKKEIIKNSSSVCGAFLSICNDNINELFNIEAGEYRWNSIVNYFILEDKLYRKFNKIGLDLELNSNNRSVWKQNSKIISEEIEKRIEKEHVSIKREMEYFLLIYKEYFSDENDFKEEKLEEVSNKIIEINEAIEKLNKEIWEITDLTIENQIKIYNNRNKLEELKRKLNLLEEEFLYYNGYLIDNKVSLKNVLELYKLFYDKFNKYKELDYSTHISSTKPENISLIYKNFVKNEGFEKDFEFEKILEENGIDIGF